MLQRLVCGKKTRYDTEDKAEKSMAYAEANGSTGWREVRTYLCPYCKKWHWGHNYDD